MISGGFVDLGLNCGLGHVRTRPDPYWPLYKGSIRGQGSNFEVGYGQVGWLLLGLHWARSRLVMAPDPQNASLDR